MCTGVETALIASVAASVLGGQMAAKESANMQSAVVSAQNKRLQQFLDRNEGRATEARQIYDGRQADMEAPPLQAAETAASARLKEALDLAASSAPAAAVPVKESAAKIIGGEYDKTGEEATAKATKRAAAVADMAGFGDALFAGSVANADAGRKIGGISSMAQSDAAMLPYYQDFAAADAMKANKPTGIGQVIAALGNVGSMYLGSGGTLGGRLGTGATATAGAVPRPKPRPWGV